MVVLLAPPNDNGTIEVLAQTSGKYYPSSYLRAPATVAGTSVTTPYNLTLVQGVYTVSFTKVQGYYAPNPRNVTVIPRGITYAVGVYDPIPSVVMVTKSGFNQTKVDAINGVTPVIWINGMSTFTVLVIQPQGRVVLQPGQNFTLVFQEPGQYQFNIYPEGQGGYVQVG